MRLRAFLFKIGVFKSEKLDAYIISIGNLTAGGAGKTPVVMHLAERLNDEGIRVAVISRGYGFDINEKGEEKRDYLVVSDLEGVRLRAGEGPDEALMTALRLKGVPVVVGPKKSIAGRVAIELFGVEVILIDDGFQHLKLKRDLDILVVNGENPLGNGLLLPAGPLRDPVGAAKRADILWLNHGTGGNGGESSAEDIIKKLRLAEDTPVVESRYMPEGLQGLSGDVYPLDSIYKKRLLVFSGIAKPDRFFETIESLGAIVVYRMPFSDHYMFKESDYLAINKIALLFNAELIITTEKDRARISANPPLTLPLLALTMGLSISGEDAILKTVISGLKTTDMEEF